MILFLFRKLNRLQIAAVALLFIGIVIVAISFWSYDDKQNKPVYLSIEDSLQLLVENGINNEDANKQPLQESTLASEANSSNDAHVWLEHTDAAQFNQSLKGDIDSTLQLPMQEVNSQLININTATAEQLQQLKGIGEAKAKAIIEDRSTNGPFNRIEDIMRVKGIGEKIFASIKESIVVSQ